MNSFASPEPFASEQLDDMARAFDRALLILGELGRDVRTRDLVVRIIINEAKRGERDCNMLCRAVLRRFGKS
jgi:hypothetical protein